MGCESSGGGGGTILIVGAEFVAAAACKSTAFKAVDDDDDDDVDDVEDCAAAASGGKGSGDVSISFLIKATAGGGLLPTIPFGGGAAVDGCAAERLQGLKVREAATAAAVVGNSPLLIEASRGQFMPPGQLPPAFVAATKAWPGPCKLFGAVFWYFFSTVCMLGVTYSVVILLLTGFAASPTIGE